MGNIFQGTFYQNLGFFLTLYYTNGFPLFAIPLNCTNAPCTFFNLWNLWLQMGVISFQNEIPTDLIRLIIFKTIRLIFKTLDNLFVKLSPVPHSFYRVCNCSLPIPFTRGCGLERKKVIFGFFLYVSGTIVQQLHYFNIRLLLRFPHASYRLYRTLRKSNHLLHVLLSKP